ncbi:DUF2142 domain-containing protein [Pseudonocardia artemisiae]
MIASWSLAAPYDGSPDEFDHVVRAVGVVSGEVAPPEADAKRGTGAFQTVPAGLVRANCWAFDPMKSAACAEPPSADATPVVAPSGAGRYYPAYYAVVGLPLKWWPGWSGLLIARLLSGALSAALLAGALVSIVRCSRHRLMLAGLLVAVTPMATYMASAINPNGMEMAAGVAFFTALIPLLVGRTKGATTGLLWLAGLSGLALAVLRASSLLWLAVGFIAFLVPWRSQNLRPLLSRKATWPWVIGIGAAGLSAVVWILAMNTTDLGDYTGGRILTASQAWMIEAENWRGYLDQMIGVTGWLDTRMSGVFYLTWQLAAGALLLASLVVARRIDRWRMLLLLGGGVLVPAYMEVRFANETGFITQGRYVLPMLAGVVLFAAFVLEERAVAAPYARTIVRLTALLLLPIHLICLLYTMARWQRGLPEVGERGITSLDPRLGDWHPIVGSATPIVAQILGLLIVGALVWIVSVRPAAEVMTSPSAESETNGRVDGKALTRPESAIAGDGSPTVSTA